MIARNQGGDGRVRAVHRTNERGRDKAAYIALFVFLALVATQVARLGASGLLVQLGQFEIDRWEAKSRSPDKEELKRSAQFFADSLSYVSDNPWALEAAGALDLAKMRGSRVPREALAATKSAYARIRQALIQRPTSPFLWANLALTKLYLNEIDGELRAALRHADELGPWEPTVQQTVLFVGLAVWRDLDPELRHTLVRTIERGASRNPQKMFEVVKSHRRFDLICAIRKYEVIAGSDCKNAAAASSGNALKQGQRP
ncbi:MAG: hypothetical protein NT123_01895 [Proteobacteria bacterium]|nr:hypothetical protein [Pseudomonadota bacterium]